MFSAKRFSKSFSIAWRPLEHAPVGIDVIAVRRPESRHGFGVALLESFDEGLGRFGDGRLLLRIGFRGARR